MTNRKVLLVTGASSDIGNVLIKRIADNYCLIWAHYCHSKGMVDELKKEYGEKIVPVQADFSDIESTHGLIEEIKKSGNIPDHIIHLSAPKAFNQKFHKCLWEDYQKGIDTSLRSVIMILQEFMPEMTKKKYGKVIFMLTAYIIGVPPKFQSSYVTVKYALFGLMRALATEYAGRGVTVNAVSPDMMKTKFLSDIPQLIIEQNAKNNSLGRNLIPSEVVPAFEYLLSEEANVVTGQNIGVTGGVR